MISIIKESWFEFLAQLKPLITATAPWILAAVALEAILSALSDDINGFIFFLFLVVGSIPKAMIAFTGLQALFRNKGVEIEVTSGKIITLILASIYIGIAVIFGFLFFVLPSLIVMAASFFVPIYILKYGQGPIEAVASSASLLQGKILHVTLLLCCVWLAIYAVQFIIRFGCGVLPVPDIVTLVISTSVSLIVGLVTLPVMINLQAHLEVEHS